MERVGSLLTPLPISLGSSSPLRFATIARLNVVVLGLCFRAAIVLKRIALSTTIFPAGSRCRFDLIYRSGLISSLGKRKAIALTSFIGLDSYYRSESTEPSL